MNLRESMTDAIRQLLNAKTREEKKTFAAQVNRLSTLTASPEERVELYSLAYQMAQARILEEVERESHSPAETVLLQTIKGIRGMEDYGEGLSEDHAAHDLLLLLRPISTALGQAESPAAARHIIRQAKSILEKFNDRELREIGYRFLRQMMEREVLAHYLEDLRNRKGSVDSPASAENYLFSLLRTLEAPAPPSLALSFLQYDTGHDVFYSVAPAELAEIDDKQALVYAMTDYMIATHKVTRQEAADCAEELKRHILLRFLRWLEEEALTRYQEIGICARFLQGICSGAFSGNDGLKPGESFQTVLDALSTAHALGMEMDIRDLALTCNDQMERLRQCACLKQSLVSMTAFSLVTQICRALHRRDISLPAVLEQLVRLYTVLSLSAQNTNPGAAFVWASAGK